jgi:hypothetical protein
MLSTLALFRIFGQMGRVSRYTDGSIGGFEYYLQGDRIDIVTSLGVLKLIQLLHMEF